MHALEEPIVTVSLVGDGRREEIGTFDLRSRSLWMFAPISRDFPPGCVVLAVEGRIVATQTPDGNWQKGTLKRPSLPYPRLEFS